MATPSAAGPLTIIMAELSFVGCDVCGALCQEPRKGRALQLDPLLLPGFHRLSSVPAPEQQRHHALLFVAPIRLHILATQLDPVLLAKVAVEGDLGYDCFVDAAILQELLRHAVDTFPASWRTLGAVSQSLPRVQSAEGDGEAAAMLRDLGALYNQ